MFISANILGVLSAITSALVWGSGDFTGGFASRRSHSLQVLVLSALSGIGVLVLGAILWQEGLPSLRSALWAVSAGVVGTVGVAALYRGLGQENAASIAPVSAVIGAGLPVGYGMLTEGAPELLRLVGFGLALVGIWLVSQAGNAGIHLNRQGLGLAVVAGLGFGGFFILIAQVEHGLVFTPLIISRTFTFLTSLLLLHLSGLKLPSVRGNPLALLAGVLDAGGNIFFLAARQLTRLDVAVVLSSLYPAVTVLLAFLLQKQKISISQWLGVGVCVAAIVMITA